MDIEKDSLKAEKEESSIKEKTEDKKPSSQS